MTTGKSSACRLPALGMVLLVAAPLWAAGLSNTPVTATETDATATTGSALTEAEKTRARSWQLSDTEWQRYRELLQGIRGSISPETISPIEVLGIHARDDAERRLYAERWAQAMHEDAERILTFQHDYDAAIRRLYPEEPLIDPAQLPVSLVKTGGLQPGDRVLFFTRTDCPVCDAVLGRLLQRIDALAGIDIYLTDVPDGDDTVVRAWARQHAIQPAWVQSRRVTLNHDAGALAKLTRGKGEVPTLMRRRGEAVTPLRAADL